MTNQRPPIVENLGNGVRRVLAPNPSAMTYWGTNTYIVGTGRVAIIDPGPDDPEHMIAILNALRPGERISHIFVTHTHLDHSPLSRPLSHETGAPIYAFGDALAGRSTTMVELSTKGLTGGGEGVDHDFKPDVLLRDKQLISGDDWSLRAIHTPGHFGNHLCFQWGELIFSGDFVMGWSTSLVSPPDGDLTDYMNSLKHLAKLDARTYYSGHGAPIVNPKERTDWLIYHRLERERAILEALKPNPMSIQKLTRSVYVDIDKGLLPLAERNVFAHLIDLSDRALVNAKPNLSLTAVFSLI